MKKKPNNKSVKNDELLSEYDFSAGVRGKYAKKFSQKTNLVLLKPEVAKVFPDSKSVNKALSMLSNVARRSLK